MDASGNKSGTTGLSLQETPTLTEAAVGRRSSHALSGALRLARFGACSRIPGTTLPSMSPIRPSLSPETFVFIRVYSWLNPSPKKVKNKY